MEATDSFDVGNFISDITEQHIFVSEMDGGNICLLIGLPSNLEHIYLWHS